MQNSNPPWARASRTGSESGGFRSEKRVSLSALLGLKESAAMAFLFSSRFAPLSFLLSQLKGFSFLNGLSFIRHMPFVLEKENAMSSNVGC